MHTQSFHVFLSAGIFPEVYLPVIFDGDLISNGFSQPIGGMKTFVVPSGTGVNEIGELEEKGESCFAGKRYLIRH
jgi:hypothetical protein